MKDAVNLLVMDKSIVADESTVTEIFSHINMIQIKYIIERFKPDE